LKLKIKSIWGFSIPQQWLSLEDARYLDTLPDKLPSVEWVWAEMDRVWEEFKLENKPPLDTQLLGDFYSHPVWIMNGIFTATDPESMRHRDAIAGFLDKIGIKEIADYGGGFGELALLLAHKIPLARVSIIEPYPSQIGISRVREKEKICIESTLQPDRYDAIIAQDVLEHVEDPGQLARQIAASVVEGGYLIFANCFYPVIQCHLPVTFHFRHTFPKVMKSLGLQYLGNLEGATHVQVFQRTGALNFAKAKTTERFSRYYGPVLNFIRPLLSGIKGFFLRK